MINIRLFSLFLLVAGTLHAYGLELNGTVATRKGDTLQTTLTVKEQYLQNYLVSKDLAAQIKYIDEKEILKNINPKKLNLVSFQYRGEDFNFYSIDIYEQDPEEGMTSTPKFYRMINNPGNAVILYEFYDPKDKKGMEVVTGDSVKTTVHKSYLAERNDNYTVVTQADFNNSVKLLFKDNPEILKQVKNGTYTFSDLPVLVNVYNNWYKARTEN